MKKLLSIPADGNARLVFFVKPGLDSFLNPIIAYLSEYFQTKKVIVTNHEQISQEMEKADICWFEWCDDLVVTGSLHPLAATRIIICRLHSFEAFSNYIYRVNWNNIDRVLFDGSHIQSYVLGKGTGLMPEKTLVNSIGINLEKYTFAERDKGFNIAYLGYINHKKGPMLLLHAFKAIHDIDSRYQLHVAGVHQEPRFQLYFDQMIKALKLEDSIHFDGWQGNLDQYLEDKQYVLVTSPLESQHISVMEGMAKGIKPLIHNFYGAAEVYDRDFLWNSLDDLVQRVTEDSYSSVRYRSFIEERYAFKQLAEQTRTLLETLMAEVKAAMPEEHMVIPKVTVGIINHNFAQYLGQCLQSVISQTHPDIEILVVDDGSTDNSLAVINSYAEYYDNIKVISDAEQAGLAKSGFQKLFEAATGTYVVILNSSNYFPDDRVLEKYLEAFEQTDGPEIDYVYGDIQLVGPSGNPAGQWNYREYQNDDIIKLVFQRWGSGLIPMAGMFRTSFYQQNSWCVDPLNLVAEEVLNCIINCGRGWVHRHVKEPLISHRRHSSAVSFQLDLRIQSLISILDYIIHHFDERLYLPSIQWDQLEEQARLALKNYAVGNHYAGMALHYLNNSFGQNLGAEQRRVSIEPILSRMNEFFELSLQAGDEHSKAIADRRASFGL